MSGHETFFGHCVVAIFQKMASHFDFSSLILCEDLNKKNYWKLFFRFMNMQVALSVHIQYSLWLQ